MDIVINIELASKKWQRAFPRMKSKIEQAAACAVLRAKKPAWFKKKSFEVNLLLATDARMRALNRDWRGMDKPTNVLSFPQMELPGRAPAEKGPVLLGDVILAFETVKRESREQKKALENHVIHLVVHGILHLLGYDHMRAKEASAMEKLESDILAVLGYACPYHDSQAENGRS